MNLSSPAAPVTNPIADAASRQQARAALDRAVIKEEGWVRIHAIEALIAVGDAPAARATVERELSTLESSSIRIGAWRVLAATAHTPEERAAVVAKITTVFLTPGSADRLQALESLCKLRAPMSAEVLARARDMAEGMETERPLSLWALHLGHDSGALERLSLLLASRDPLVRFRAAYALRWLRPEERNVLARVAAAADAEGADSVAFPYLVSAALVLNADAARVPTWLRAARSIVAIGTAGARYEICQALAQRGEPLDPAGLAPVLMEAGGDAAIGAALLGWSEKRKE